MYVVKQSYFESMWAYLRWESSIISEQLKAHCSEEMLDIVQSSNMNMKYSHPNFSSTYGFVLV